MDQSQPHLKVSSEERQKELTEKIHEMTERESEELLKADSLAQGVGYVNLKGHIITEECYEIIPQARAQELELVCFEFVRHHTLKIACRTLTENVKTFVHELSERFSTPAAIYLTSHQSLTTALKGYDRLPKVIPSEEVLLTPEQITQASQTVGSSLQQFSAALSSVNVSEAVAMVLAAALKFKSSDVHLEDEQDHTLIRFRIDGVLHSVGELERHFGKQMISRVKLIAGLKINITDRPQDGHFEIRLEDSKVDVRVSALPTNFGESLALRILESSAERISFNKLGMFPWTRSFLEKEMIRPAGLLVVCGPTGSGKTTSLYAILLKVNSPDIKILTIEDPIEYEIRGVSQSQVDDEHGYTFAKGLRSLVRQDPDVIMIGEIRDADTVDIALQASLTGHLVLSTLHTNSSAGAIPRFLAMGAKPYLLAPALNSVMSQRLVRKLCPSCKEQTNLSSEQKEIIDRELPVLEKYFKEAHVGEVKFFHSRGCPECGGIGFQGRVGIFEHLNKTTELEKEILSSTMSESQLKAIQKHQGMVSILQDGILKSLLGITSLDEILRVVDVE